MGIRKRSSKVLTHIMRRVSFTSGFRSALKSVTVGGVMDIDVPNTRPGFCPVCARRANIWDAPHWHCTFCNWNGVRPDAEPHIKLER